MTQSNMGCMNGKGIDSRAISRLESKLETVCKKCDLNRLILIIVASNIGLDILAHIT